MAPSPPRPQPADPADPAAREVGEVGTTAAATYRPEIQGLRALACVLVVGYHVWTDRISGGVDVFFLMTGFLVTGQLVRAGTAGPIRVRRRWGRTVRRLSPAAITVLLGTAPAGVVLLPASRWPQTAHHLLASTFYLENWRLAADTADYFTRTSDTSVVQHFWSLSVQGQFLLVWPLVMAVLVLHVNQRLRVATGVTLAGVFVVSLGYSVWLTAVDQPLAYFSSLTRLWELALGGLLSLVVDRARLPSGVRVACGWLGVGGIVSCGLVLAVGAVFPGYAALWPTVSAALVIVAGASGSRVGVDRVLRSAPATYVGRLSYALYLWHWPVLAFALVLWGRTTVGPLGGLVVVGITVVLSVATHHLVERPRPGRAPVLSRTVRVAVPGLLAVCVAAGLWPAAPSPPVPPPVAVVGGADHPGARALAEGFVYQGRPDAPLLPSFREVSSDWATIDRCEPSPRRAELLVCLDPISAEPARRIVIVGDSHPLQLAAGLKPVAEQRHWQLIVMWRGSCPFSTVSEIDPGDEGCKAWNTAATEEILDLRPDAVVTMATRDVRPGVDEWTPPGYVAQWEKLATEAIPVVAVRDNPRYATPPSVCVETRGADASECSTPRADLYAAEAPYSTLDNLPPNVSFLDLSDYFCGPDVCPPVIGNVLVYMDDNHLTATYLATMSPVLADAIDTALGWSRAPEPTPATA